jgi:hypothetical protein
VLCGEGWGIDPQAFPKYGEGEFHQSTGVEHEVEGYMFAYLQGHDWVLYEGQWEEHFEFVDHNVLTEDMNDGGMEYVKFAKVGLKQSSECLAYQHVPEGSSMDTRPSKTTFGCYSY